MHSHGQQVRCIMIPFQCELGRAIPGAKNSGICLACPAGAFSNRSGKLSTVQLVMISKLRDRCRFAQG